MDYESGGIIGSGGSATAGILLGDKFGFNYETSELDDIRGKLYLLLSPKAFLHPSLNEVQKYLESNVLSLDDYLQTEEGGFYVTGQLWAKGRFDVSPLILPLDIHFGGSGSEKFKTTGSLISYANGNYGVSTRLFRDREESEESELALKTLWSQSSTNLLKPFKSTIGTFYGSNYEIVFNQQLQPTTIKVTLSWMPEKSASSEEILYEQEWTISASSNILKDLCQSSSILKLLMESVNATEFKEIDITILEIIQNTDTFLRDVVLRMYQNTPTLSVATEKRIVNSKVTDNPVFSLDIGPSAILEISVGANLDTNWKESYVMPIEKSRLIGNYEYKTEAYEESAYSPINISWSDIYKKALGDCWSSI